MSPVGLSLFLSLPLLSLSHSPPFSLSRSLHISAPFLRFSLSLLSLSLSLLRLSHSISSLSLYLSCLTSLPLSPPSLPLPRVSVEPLLGPDTGTVYPI